MTKDWQTLTLEQMHVTAIRLFDLGHRDEAVYWFHSARLRFRLIHAALKKDEKGNISKYAEAHLRGLGAFSLLSGQFINRYAFRFPARLTKTLNRIIKSSEKLPALTKIYPQHEFVEESQRAAALKTARGGTDRLIEAVALIKPSRGKRATQQDLEEAFAKKTQLHKAFEASDKKKFLQLLKEGADPNFRPFAASCLMAQASKQADPYWIRTLLKFRGDPNLLDTGHQNVPEWTPLLFAVSNWRQKNALQLIAAGADVKYSTNRGDSALYRAEQNRDWHTFMILLDAGADPRRPNRIIGASKSDLIHYNNLGPFEFRRHERRKKEYGLDYTLDEEREMHIKVRQRLIKDGYLKPDPKEESVKPSR
ncbi:MAG: ankyrin repeat domain-containing protein [Planctomycetes bacterium]|nr:ankyrin repeat domain-containing protein [Planctomycetota bacterium]